VGPTFRHKYQILIANRQLVPFNVSSHKEWLDYLHTSWIFGNQSVSSRFIDNKCLIKAGEHAQIDLSVYKFTERYAFRVELIEQCLRVFISQSPAAIIKGSLINIIAVLFDIIV